jgi:hypothetical protein
MEEVVGTEVDTEFVLKLRDIVPEGFWFLGLPERVLPVRPAEAVLADRCRPNFPGGLPLRLLFRSLCNAGDLRVEERAEPTATGTLLVDRLSSADFISGGTGM